MFPLKLLELLTDALSLAEFLLSPKKKNVRICNFCIVKLASKAGASEYLAHSHKLLLQPVILAHIQFAARICLSERPADAAQFSLKCLAHLL